MVVTAIELNFGIVTCLQDGKVAPTRHGPDEAGRVGT